MKIESKEVIAELGELLVEFNRDPLNRHFINKVSFGPERQYSFLLN